MPNDCCDTLEDLYSKVVHTLVIFVRWFADAEGTKYLAGVSIVLRANLGDEHVARLQDAIRLQLRWNAEMWVMHGGGCHVVDVRLPAKWHVRALDDGG
jgi:hypothetical protein